MDQHAARDRPYPEPAPRGWWFDAALVAGFAAITAALAWWPPLARADLAVRAWCAERATPATLRPALVLDHLGQGGPLTALTVLVSFAVAWPAALARPDHAGRRHADRGDRVHRDPETVDRPRHAAQRRGGDLRAPGGRSSTRRATS
ncbi:hypothetical protein [Dactylosporangium sp. CA-139066]|uniref:hypothetical protein n=1 Tax=Dactylosporangium sp. CA-139066 TaxID=3239930 RepID=UPI003D94CFC7